MPDLPPSGRVAIVVLLAFAGVMAVACLFVLASPDAVRPATGRHKARRWQRGVAIVLLRRFRSDLATFGLRWLHPMVLGGLAQDIHARARALATISWGRRAPAPVIQPTVIWQPSNVRLLPSTSHEDPVPVGELPPPVDDPTRTYSWDVGEFAAAIGIGGGA